MTEGNGRILSLNGAGRNAKDEQGRTLRHNATVLDAHQIAVDEARKVHEFYLGQIPPFVAQMITDALVSYGLIQVQPEAAPTSEPVPQREPTVPGESLAGEIVGAQTPIGGVPVAPMEDTARECSSCRVVFPDRDALADHLASLTSGCP